MSWYGPTLTGAMFGLEKQAGSTPIPCMDRIFCCS